MAERLPGTIVEQCGPDEWYVCVAAPGLAVLEDGRAATDNTPGDDLFFPCCFRDSSEIRPRTPSDNPASSTRPGVSR